MKRKPQTEKPVVPPAAPDVADGKRGLGACVRAEWLVAVVLTLAAGWMHVRLLQHGGNLWRDEITTVAIAQSPTLAGFRQLLTFDSFPALPALLLRWWTTFAGGSDGALRLFGCLVGLGGLAALWITGRWLGCFPPLLALALFGLNVAAVRGGDMLRGYGLGTLFILLSLGLVWRLATAPGRRIFVGAALATVAATQCLYQNAFLVLAVCLGGMAVTVRRRQWRQTAMILLVGGLAAVSLLPYLPVLAEGRRFVAIYQHEATFGQLLGELTQTLGHAGGFMPGVWGMLLVMGGCLAVLLQFPSRFGLASVQRDLCLYSLVVLVVSLLVYGCFLVTLKYKFQTYYFIPLLAVAAVFLDAVRAALPEVALRKFLSVCLGLGILGAGLPEAWTASRVPFSNVGPIAAKVGAAAAKDDLIVVMPWYLGAPFHRYYRGDVPWITVPELTDYAIQREDLLVNQLATVNAAGSALERIQRTLQRGNKVWLICQYEFMHQLPQDWVPPHLPPAPQGPGGWHCDPYLQLWAKETWHLLQTRVRRGADVVIPAPTDGSQECLPLMVFEGWK